MPSGAGHLQAPPNPRRHRKAGPAHRSAHLVVLLATARSVAATLTLTLKEKKHSRRVNTPALRARHLTTAPRERRSDPSPRYGTQRRRTPAITAGCGNNGPRRRAGHLLGVGPRASRPAARPDPRIPLSRPTPLPGGDSAKRGAGAEGCRAFQSVPARHRALPNFPARSRRPSPPARSAPPTPARAAAHHRFRAAPEPPRRTGRGGDVTTARGTEQARGAGGCAPWRLRPTAVCRSDGS